MAFELYLEIDTKFEHKDGEVFLRTEYVMVCPIDYDMFERIANVYDDCYRRGWVSYADLLRIIENEEEDEELVAVAEALVEAAKKYLADEIEKYGEDTTLELYIL